MKGEIKYYKNKKIKDDIRIKKNKMIKIRENWEYDYQIHH
jgi:hypothetical protein